MTTFKELNISRQLLSALNDLGYEAPTPIQKEAFSVILSGKNVVGIAQTGTGKTLAYLLPLLRDLKYSEQLNPRILIMVPTRELVLQVVDRVESLAEYMTVRVLGVYGGTNINTQKKQVMEGVDILVATPGRLYDLVLHRTVQLKDVKKLVIDEVDVMLDLGFRFQLTNIFDLLPGKRQNLMFSATMTPEVDALINDFFIAPEKISIAVSGTPLENIAQQVYPVPNFYTKANLLAHLLQDKQEFKKVLVFVGSKKNADRLFNTLEPQFGSQLAIIHSNKSQNFRLRSIEQFDNGTSRILIATDVIARGLDLDKISHVINFNTPEFPENYMHRIGRTGRAEEEGKSILFYTEKEEPAKLAIEALMDYEIPAQEFPSAVKISKELIPDERPKEFEINLGPRKRDTEEKGAAFHEKKPKNQKVNEGGAYRKSLKKKKHKKPRTRGDKKLNQKKKGR